ncbi:MAG TPA: hypothetical protein EYP58_04885, partial [bacterium (Candidatus Stahlbacteria)]|nr:hypothetical protein [Candidatus Stahlbacteria bacterium]
MTKLQINLLRMLIILTMVLMMVYSDRGLEFASLPYYIALAYLLFNLVCFLILSQDFYLSMLFQYLLIVIDIAIITLTMYLTSGFQSDFYLVYFLVIFVSSIGGQVKGSFYTAAVIAIIYAWIYSRGDLNLLLDSRFLIRLPFFLIVAFYTSLWAGNVRKATIEKRQLEEFNIRLKEQIDSAIAQFEEVSRFSENLMRSVGSGVIAVNNDIRIVLFNPYAEEILSIKAKDVIYKPITDIDCLTPIADVLRQTLNEHRELRREILDIRIDEKDRKLGFSTSILKDRTDSPAGSMMLFTDLTNVFELQAKLKRSEHLAHIGEM